MSPTPIESRIDQPTGSSRVPSLLLSSWLPQVGVAPDPIDTVIAVNEAVRSNPALVNTAPYAEGWLFKLEPKDAAARETLKSPADYRAQIG